MIVLVALCRPCRTAAATAAADDMRILPLKDVGHWPQFERPEIVTEAIARLIAENVARD